MKTKIFLLTLLGLLVCRGGLKAQDMTATPLTLEAVEAGTINIVNRAGLTIEYNKNGGGWTASSENPISIPVAAGDKVQFRGDNSTYTSYEMSEDPTSFTATNPVYVYGNVMSLISSTDFATLKKFPESEMDMGGNLAFLFAEPENAESPFPKENTTIRNHPEYDIVLPATELPMTCYMYMFSGCAALTRGPELPAMKLAPGCYHRLFDGCTSLETAPTLPAKKLVDDCYSCMFSGCTSLKYVKCLATDLSGQFSTDWWMEGVPEGGTFVKATSNNSWPTGINGIPEGWTVEDATAEDGDMAQVPFTMEAIANGAFTIDNPQGLTIQYNKNGADWTSARTNPITIEVVAGDKVEFRADNNGYCFEGMDATHFRSSSDCYIYGNIMSLIKSNLFAYATTLEQEYAFANLFMANDEMEPNYTLKSHPTKELVLPATTLTQMCYSMMFQGCRGLTSAPMLPATTLAPLCYNDMFADCTGLTEAPQLPAKTLAMGCYTMMFYGCTSLTTAPVLPAPILVDCCYDSMFSGCSKLSYVKCLATSINGFATANWMDGVASTGIFTKMSQMHDWETGVDGIPEGWMVMSATQEDGDMGATPLTLEAASTGTITINNPNGLPVNYEIRTVNTNLSTYNNKETVKTFDVEPGDVLVLTGNNAAYGNIDPTQAFHISSTADVYVYGNVMSLVNSWNFADATTLTGKENFACLFGDDGTTNSTIRNHPTKDIVLGATTLTESCYSFMFAGCQGLTRAPELPAKTLASTCYHRMFGNCTGLTAAPALPAPALVEECYFAMFDGCNNLNYVKCLATDLGEHNTDMWLNDVAPRGTFIMADGMTGWTKDSPDGIPAGWGTTDTPLTLEAIEAETAFTITNPLQLGIEYSTDNGATWTMEYNPTITISGIAAGGTVQLRGYNPSYSTDGTATNSTNISADKDHYIYGNIMSLINRDEYPSLTTLTGKYAFARLFRNDSHLKNHPTKEIMLPATILSPQCYRYTFQNCTGLTKAPVLPATTMAEGCYFATFIGCSSLTTAPKLPSTKLAPGCYTGLFANSGLTTAPVLPATELAERCYYQMFYGCANLTDTPELPAMTVPRSGYNQMFYNCTSLTATPLLPATTVYDFGYNMMFRGCTGLTTYSKISATTLVGEDSMQGMFYECSNLETADDLSITKLGTVYSCSWMFHGCTNLTKAPALPATKLTAYCYNRMFDECTSLVTAPQLPATQLADLCYNDMFMGCTSLKNAPVLPATTLVDYCYTMMFSGCTSLEKAPDLPAKNLPSGCYEHMFEGCSSLNYVKCLATSITDETSTWGWLTGVAPTGTFVKAAGMVWTIGPDDNKDVNGIPEGWNVETDEGATNPTGISVVKPSETHNYYDLSGRRINGQPQRGIYVKDGKKFIVR